MNENNEWSAMNGKHTEEGRGREMEGAGIESKGSEAATGDLADGNGFESIDFFGNELIVSIAVSTLPFRAATPRVHHSLLCQTRRVIIPR
jgi:hypothetical protein